LQLKTKGQEHNIFKKLLYIYPINKDENNIHCRMIYETEDSDACLFLFHLVTCSHCFHKHYINST
jgi:hypothetical protein